MQFVAQTPNERVLYSQPSGRQSKGLATSHPKRQFMLNGFEQPVEASRTNGGILNREESRKIMKNTWPRDQYTGIGGGLYTGIGGGLYTGIGGGAYTGIGGGMYTGIGGGLYTGIGGGLYTGPGGGLYTGPGGGLYTGPGGGLYSGPRGGLYSGPGGGLYTGPCSEPYSSNWPPIHVLVEYLVTHGMMQNVKTIADAHGINTFKRFGVIGSRR